MSSGSLYAAKVTQAAGVSDAAEASFAVSWIKLGTGNEDAIEAAIRSFDGTFAEAKHITQAQIDAFAAGNNPFSDDRIAFLESRKVAAAKGATAEWNKMEGININFDLASAWWNNGAANGDQAYMYLAMSDVTGGMSDGTGDIKVTANRCGVVYRMKLVKNASGLVDITKIVPAVAGGPYDSNASPNRCSVANISNPDNIVILKDGRVLIGEDTGNHENNMIWLFNDPAL
jgi:secreted PhoX family phosphatase